MEQENKLGREVPYSADEGGTFKDRVSELIRLCGSTSRLARSSGVSESVVRKWRDGQSEPTLSNLVALANAGGKSIEWLATGKDSLPNPINVNKGHDMTSEEWSEFACIPLYNVEVSAGHGIELQDEETVCSIAFRQDWLRSKGFQKEHLATISARGDSMEPTILNGNLLLINCLKKEVTADSIYVIRSDGRLYVKRLQKMCSGEIYINSDNPAYKTEVITVDKLNDLEIIGRVVWVGHEI